jgi:drug/metabolite transporter (DMT)-like permease
VLQVLLFSLIVLAGTGGELCMSRAMKKVGETKRERRGISSFHPAEILRVVLRGLTMPWMWLGVALMAVAFFSLLGALALYNVSLVVPVTALSYVAGALGGRIFLHERVTKERWMGVAFVVVGVTLVVLGKSR